MEMVFILDDVILVVTDDICTDYFECYEHILSDTTII